jgi:hypothetical protein
MAVEFLRLVVLGSVETNGWVRLWKSSTGRLYIDGGGGKTLTSWIF